MTLAPNNPSTPPPAGGAAPTITAVDQAFGRPISSTTIGSLSVYVFPYDIATKLGG